MTTLDDPFALPAESKVTERDSILSRGRYMLPWRDGSHKTRGFQRVSNLVSAYSDQFGLRMWELGEVLQGVAMNPELYANLLQANLPAMDRATRKAWVEEFIEHAKEASGGNFGSKFGQQRHAVVEAHHAGLPLGYVGADTRRHLSLYAAALKRNGLVALPGMQERRVLVESLEVVGTLDNVLGQACSHNPLEPCNECFNEGWTNPVIADLKTQRKFWTWLEIGAQLACYAHGDAMWDTASGTWVDMPHGIAQDIALVLWMPRETDDGEPRVDVWEVDIVAGWETAQNAYRVVKDRATAKSARNPRAWLRKAPEPTLTEKYAARFAAVDTIAQGRALVAEAKKAGAWSEILAECAREAANRVRVPA